MRLIVAAPEGTAPDLVARALSGRFAELWKQQVTVENRPGAGGSTAMEFVKNAVPDGYTLMLANSGAVLVTPLVSKTANYDPINDFAQLGHVADSPMMIVAGNHVSRSTLSFMLAAGKADPEKIKVGSTEQATLPYLLGKRLSMFTGARFTHVAYANPAQGMQALVNGEIDYYIDGVAPLLPLIKAGKVKPVAAATEKGLASLPGTPLVRDTVPTFIATGWFALMGPKGLPPELATRINQDLNKLLEEKAVVAKLNEMSLLPAPRTPFESTLFIKTEISKWGAVIRSNGLAVR